MAEQLTTAQAAERLGVKPRRVLALIEAKQLPAKKFGHAWMIDAKDLKKVQERRPGWPAGRPRRPTE